MPEGTLCLSGKAPHLWSFRSTNVDYIPVGGKSKCAEAAPGTLLLQKQSPRSRQRESCHRRENGYNRGGMLETRASNH